MKLTPKPSRGFRSMIPSRRVMMDDDQGRPIELLPMREFSTIPKSPETRYKPEGSTYRELLRYFGIGFAAIALFLTILIWAKPVLYKPTGYAIGIVIMAMIWYSQHMIFRIFHRGFARLLIKCKVCPACNYDLSGCVPQSDQCCVCPECGAAWRIE